MVIISSIQIPFIDNVIFNAISNSSSTTIINRTCDECLRLSNSSYIALNCFPNDTCQLFYAYPITYIIQSTSQARLYFPQNIFPNPSQGCMSNTSSLLNKIDTITSIHASVPSPRCIVLDNHNYLVTVSQTKNSIVRFYASNLTLISYPVSPIFNSSPMSITYYNYSYYVGLRYYILVMDSTNFTILSNISSSHLSGTRGMMFLNDGQMLVVASTYNKYLLFFNRTSSVSKGYTFAYLQAVDYVYPHGLWYINDTYFYVTSWGNNTIYSYSAVNNSTVWTQKLFLDAWSVTGGSGGNHLTIDKCGRYWFSLGLYGIKIFDSQGFVLGNITNITAFVFDTIISDTYVIYLSDTTSNRVIRLDLNI